MFDVKSCSDAWACSRLSVLSLHYSDHRLAEGFASQFMEDGVFDRDGDRIVGRLALAKNIVDRPENLTVRHIVSAPVVVAEASKAVSVYGVFVTRTDTLTATSQMFIADVRDEYVKTGEGIWRISMRTARLSR